MDLPSQTGRAPSSSLEPGASKAQSHLWCQGWSRQPPWHKGERGGAGPPADLSDMLCLFSSIQSIPLRARGRVRPPLAFARVWEGLGTMPAAWRNAGGRSSRLARLEWTQTPPHGRSGWAGQLAPLGPRPDPRGPCQPPGPSYTVTQGNTQSHFWAHLCSEGNLCFFPVFSLGKWSTCWSCLFVFF